MDTEEQRAATKMTIVFVLASVAVIMLAVAIFKIITFEPTPEPTPKGANCGFIQTAIDSGTGTQSDHDYYAKYC